MGKIILLKICQMNITNKDLLSIQINYISKPHLLNIEKLDGYIQIIQHLQEKVMKMDLNNSYLRKKYRLVMNVTKHAIYLHLNSKKIKRNTVNFQHIKTILLTHFIH